MIWFCGQLNLSMFRYSWHIFGRRKRAWWISIEIIVLLPSPKIFSFSLPPFLSSLSLSLSIVTHARSICVILVITRLRYKFTGKYLDLSRRIVNDLSSIFLAYPMSNTVFSVNTRTPNTVVFHFAFLFYF